MQREIENADNELESLNLQKEKIAEILRDNQSTAELQRQKQEYERKLEDEKAELVRCNNLFMNYYNDYITTYVALPLMDQAEDFLANANVDDRGIRDMTEASIRDIIKRGRCICGAPMLRIRMAGWEMMHIIILCKR